MLDARGKVAPPPLYRLLYIAMFVEFERFEELAASLSKESRRQSSLSGLLLRCCILSRNLCLTPLIMSGSFQCLRLPEPRVLPGVSSMISSSTKEYFSYFFAVFLETVSSIPPQFCRQS